MKRNITVCALALALTFGVAGCTSEKAPDVTPTPTPAATATPSVNPTATPDMLPETAAPTDGAVGSAHRPVAPHGINHSSAYDNAQYHANGFYHGTDAQDIARDMTNGVKNAVDNTGRAIEDMGNGVRNMTH